MTSNVLLKWTFGPQHAVLTIQGYAVTPVLPRCIIRLYSENAPDGLLTKLAYLIDLPWVDPREVLATLADADIRTLRYGEVHYLVSRSWFDQNCVAVVDRGTKGGLI